MNRKQTACAPGRKRDLTRRAFLRNAALVAGGAAASGLISVPSFANALAPDSPVATLKTGQVRGYVDDGVNVFKGIPYGADTAPRRFMPPVPPAAWTGVRDALEYGPASPQQARADERTSEDCL